MVHTRRSAAGVPHLQGRHAVGVPVRPPAGSLRSPAGGRSLPPTPPNRRPTQGGRRPDLHGRPVLKPRPRSPSHAPTHAATDTKRPNGTSEDPRSRITQPPPRPKGPPEKTTQKEPREKQTRQTLLTTLKHPRPAPPLYKRSTGPQTTRPP